MNHEILPQTSLILVMGRPGTGKSTLCGALLKQVSAVYLDIDSVSDLFREYVRNVSPRKIANLTLRLIYRLAEQNLKNKSSVLLDLPFVHEMTLEERRLGLQELAQRSGAALIIIHCVCSERELKRRMSARATAQDMAKLKNWSAFQRREPSDVTIPFEHVVINTESDAVENVRCAAAHILERASTIA